MVKVKKNMFVFHKKNSIFRPAPLLLSTAVVFSMVFPN